MESFDNIKREEVDTDKTESDWFGYGSKTGEIFFYYNIKTGAHRWPTNSSYSEKTIIRVRTSDVPPKPNELCSVATQTEDYGCVNQCTSMYVDNERQMENTESNTNEIKEEVSNDDSIDDTEQNMLDNTDVDGNLDAVCEDFEVDESLSTIITEMKRRKDLVQNARPQHQRDTVIHNSPLLVDPVQTHTVENPYECSYCDKAFARKSELDRHLRTHTGEKSYECSYCDLAFTEKNHVVTHLRKYTGVKPYECSYCAKAFAWKSDLYRHLRTHTGEKPFECSNCDKAFADQSCLKRHLRTHTGEKPYECSYCEKAFTRKYNLNFHLRRHTGEKH